MIYLKILGYSFASVENTAGAWQAPKTMQCREAGEILGQYELKSNKMLNLYCRAE